MTILRAGGGAVASHIKPVDLPLQLDPDGTSIAVGDDTAITGSPRDVFAHQQASQQGLFAHGTMPGTNVPAVVSYVTDWQLSVAETYITDACKGRPPHVRMQHKDSFLCFKSWTPLRVYDMIHHRHWRWLMSFLVTLQLLLGFFEHNADFRPFCSIIEVLILSISVFDVALRLFCHDSQPTKSLHSICQAPDGVLLDHLGQPLGGALPDQGSSTHLHPSNSYVMSSSSNMFHETSSLSSTGSVTGNPKDVNKTPYKGNRPQNNNETPLFRGKLGLNNDETPSMRGKSGPNNGQTPVLRPLPSFKPSNTSSQSSLFSLNTASPQKNNSNGNDHRGKDEDGKKMMNFAKFYENHTEFTSAMVHNPDIIKHIPAITNSATAVQQRQLPTIEAPTARFSKQTSPFLRWASKYLSWSRVRLFFIIITFIDIFFTFVFRIQFSRVYRLTRLIRPYFFLEKGRVLRQLVKAVARTIPSVLEVVVLIFLTISTFSIAGFFLFSEKGLRIGDNPFFSTLENSMFSMTVLMTTANFPDVMMDSYSVSNPSALFFCTFLIIALYLLFNVILSAVYSRFQYEAYRLLHTIPLTQLYALTAAFELLSRPPNTPVIPEDMIPPLHLNENTRDPIFTSNLMHSPLHLSQSRATRQSNHSTTTTTTTTTTHHPNDHLETILPSQFDSSGINSSSGSNSDAMAIPLAPDQINNQHNSPTNQEIDPLLKSNPQSGSYGAISTAIPLHSLPKRGTNGNIEQNNNNNSQNGQNGQNSPQKGQNGQNNGQNSYTDVQPIPLSFQPNTASIFANHTTTMSHQGSVRNTDGQSYQNQDEFNEPLLGGNNYNSSNSSFDRTDSYNANANLTNTHNSNQNEFKTNTRRCIDQGSIHQHHPLSFSQWKKQSWLYLLNLGYTLHSKVNIYEQYKVYLQMYNNENEYQALLRQDKGPFSCSCQDVISQDTFMRLIKRMRPDLTPQQSILLFEAMDQQHHHHIHINEWFAFADFMDVKFINAEYRTVKQELAIVPSNIPRNYPTILHWIGTVLTHWSSNLILDLIVAIHFAVLLVQLEVNSKDSIWTHIMDNMNLVLLIVYSIEYFFKIIIFGPKRIYKSLLCSFEIILLITAYILYIFYLFSNRDNIFNPNSNYALVRWLHTFFTQPSITSLALTSTDILAFRAARLYRHLYRFPRFRAILTTLKRLYPALRSLAVILVSEYYFFGLLGVCLFRGVIKKGQMSEEFMMTYWAQNNYWENNFEDLYHAYITLFEIMIINNWNLNIEGWTVALNSHWPRVFFVCHFFLAIVIILNCVIALVLDAFISKYSSNQDLERQNRAQGNTTVKDHIRDQRRQQKQQEFQQSQTQRLSSSTASTSHSNDGNNAQFATSLSSSGSIDAEGDYVMLDEETQYEPYELDESSSDDEGQQLVITLIKRADHQGTIEEDLDDEYDQEGNFIRHRSGTIHHRSTRAGTLLNGRLPTSRSNARNEENNEQQRIVFKRRTQRMYQMIFDSGKS